jgi:hypothetical protein
MKSLNEIDRHWNEMPNKLRLWLMKNTGQINEWKDSGKEWKPFIIARGIINIAVQAVAWVLS